MEELKKSYYAIIPAEVRYDKELTANAKLLYGEITALCNEKGYCWASNNYFAKLYSVSTRTISSWISNLATKEYIHVTIIHKENSKEIASRYISLKPLPDKNSIPMEENFNTYRNKFQYPIEENFHTPMEENFQENNTINNNTINNKYDIYKEVVEIYNNTCTKLPIVQKMSKSRLAQLDILFRSITLEDFKNICVLANESEFLTGNNQNKWKADFDFIIREEKAISILEGKYNKKINKEPKAGAFDFLLDD